ncbi:ABC transporter ATP-binding protein [Corticibacterium sp. UT-5YL-CI-8]|nr:ABC transporter ATP-binding protein [Tianweitania sp. UT-5YL-CI-8]
MTDLSGTDLTQPPSPDAQPDAPLLSVRRLVKEYPGASGFWGTGRQNPIRAVADVSFDIHRGETLGLVGESGCGKSTLAKCILGLVDVTSGDVTLDGVNLVGLAEEDMRLQRRKLQVVFQDPSASLHPRMRVAEIVSEPLRLLGMSGAQRMARARELITLVRLNQEHLERFPHQLSGGQRQRVGIARALAVSPRVILLDEPVSALDVSIQAGVLNLLGDLQQTLQLSYLFVAHNLSTVRHVCQRVAVMYLGKIVEVAPRDELFSRPRHPYTHALLSAVPLPDPKRDRARERIVLQGDPPSPANPPNGCYFRTRCWKATEICAKSEPQLVRHGDVSYACHHPLVDEVGD